MVRTFACVIILIVDDNIVIDLVKKQIQNCEKEN